MRCVIGLDLGTSGCRGLAVDEAGRMLAKAQTPVPAPLRTGAAGVEQAADLWWQAVVRVLADLAPRCAPWRPAALCLDATSSTLLLCAPDGTPLAPALMYNDARSTAAASRIAGTAPPNSPARGASSSLAKLLYLAERLSARGPMLALHQADWVIGRLTGRFGVSDWNNALKLGYDPVRLSWPRWLDGLLPSSLTLPEVLAPGTPVATLSGNAAAATGLPTDLQILTGTTDSTAAVIATGARAPGDAVTCLGSTLVIKVVSSEPVTAPEYGVYSHRFGDRWLTGGASNSGGAVLRLHFSDRRMRELTAALRPDEPTGLDYYPLPATGERFPVQDPALAPRTEPRPGDDARFFQGLLEGIATIEAAGYARLADLGAPRPHRVLTIGGGAVNAAWGRIRERLLGVPVLAAERQEAAYGAAMLALAWAAQAPPERP